MLDTDDWAEAQVDREIWHTIDFGKNQVKLKIPDHSYNVDLEEDAIALDQWKKVCSRYLRQEYIGTPIETGFALGVYEALAFLTVGTYGDNLSINTGLNGDFQINIPIAQIYGATDGDEGDDTMEAAAVAFDNLAAWIRTKKRGVAKKGEIA